MHQYRASAMAEVIEIGIWKYYVWLNLNCYQMHQSGLCNLKEFLNNLGNIDYDNEIMNR